jgi:hypothetical protein
MSLKCYVFLTIMYFRLFLGEGLLGELFIGQGGVYNLLLTKVRACRFIFYLNNDFMHLRAILCTCQISVFILKPDCGY